MLFAVKQSGSNISPSLNIIHSLKRSAFVFGRHYAMTSSSPGTDGDMQLLYNARIWQSSGDDMTWMTFSPRSGLISGVGRHKPPPLDLFPPDRRRDVTGRRIIPGLHDSHVHLTYLGRRLRSLDLSGCRSVDEIQQQVRCFAAERPSERWIIGHGWDQRLLGRCPTRDDVDIACGDRPVHLIRICCHASVENSLALKLAGSPSLSAISK